MPSIRPITFADYYKKVLTPQNINNHETKLAKSSDKIVIKNNGLSNKNFNHIINKKK